MLIAVYIIIQERIAEEKVDDGTTTTFKSTRASVLITVKALSQESIKLANRSQAPTLMQS